MSRQGRARAAQEKRTALDNEHLLRAAFDAQDRAENQARAAVNLIRDGCTLSEAPADALAAYEEARAALAERAGVSPGATLSEMVRAIEQARTDALERLVGMQADAVQQVLLDPLMRNAQKLLDRRRSDRDHDPAVADVFVAIIELQESAAAGNADPAFLERLNKQVPELVSVTALAAVGQLPLAASDDADSDASAADPEEHLDPAAVGAAETAPSGDIAASRDNPLAAAVTLPAAKPSENGGPTEPAAPPSAASPVPAVPPAVPPPVDLIPAAATKPSARRSERRAELAPARTAATSVIEAPRNGAEPSAPASAEPSPPSEQEVDDALVSLIAQRRFGLAHHVARVAGRPGLAQALKLCAYADGLTSSMGSTALALRELLLDLTTTDDLDLDRPPRLLASAGALRVAAVAPYLGAWQVLRSFEPAIGDGADNLQSFCSEVRGLAEKGVSITQDYVEQSSDAAALEEQQADLRRKAEDLIANPGTIKFARATDLWRTMVQTADHPIGRALRCVQDDDASARRDVMEAVAQLRNRRELELMIDALDQRLRRPSVKKRIEGPARESLRLRVSEVVDLAEQWVEVGEGLERLRRSDENGRLLLAMEPVREAARLVREDGPPVDWPEGDVVLRAAASELRAAVEDVAGYVLDACYQPPRERSAELLLGGELLRDPEIRLDETLQPLSGDDLPALLALVDPPDWKVTFERRAERRDHDLLSGVLTLIADQDPVLGASLRQRADDLLIDARHDYERQYQHVGARLSTAYLQGALLPDEWQARELERERLAPREDDTAIGTKLDELAALDAAVQRQAKETAAERSEELRERLAALPTADATAAERLESALAIGDVATAEELLLAIERGHELPPQRRSDPELERWYPELPEQLPQDLSLEDVAERLGAGESIFGVEGGALDPDQVETAVTGLRAWSALRAQNDAQVRSALGEVLALLGLEVTSSRRVAGPAGDGVRQYDVTALPLGDVLIPHFASKAGGRYRIMLVDAAGAAPDRLMALLEGRGTRAPTLLLHLGVVSVRQRQRFADLARTRRSELQAMLVDVSTLIAVATLDPGRFGTTERATLPFTGLNPYVPYASGLVPPEMFFGRREQLDDLLSRDGTIAFIHGGRRLGKSALLRATEREIAEEDPQVVCRYIDLGNQRVGDSAPPEQTLAIIEAELDAVLPRAGTGGDMETRLAARVKKLLEAEEGRRILVLLDECDSFISADAKRKFRTLMALRALMEDTGRRFRPVFAGLHAVRRFDEVSNQRLVQFGAPSKSIGALRPLDATALIERPLEALGYRLDRESVHQILTLTQHQPSLIQLVCDHLVGHMLARSRPPETPPYPIARHDLEQVLALPELAREIRARFELTISLDPRYKMIALVVAYLAADQGMTTHFDMHELKAQSEQFWSAGFRDTDATEFRALLDEMDGLGVLHRDEEDDKYGLRSPHVARMLGTQKQIEDRLLELASEEPAETTFDGSTFREELLEPSGETSLRRSPLTLRQSQELLKPHDGLRIVIGSSALGAGAVRDALAQLAQRVQKCEHKAFGTEARDADRKRFSRAMKQSSGHKGSHQIVSLQVVDANADRLAEVIDDARAGLRRRRAIQDRSICGVLLVDEAGVHGWRELSQRWLEQQLQPPPEIIRLRRWDASGLRTWLLDPGVDLPAVLDDDIQRVLEVTGGWPMLVERFVAELHRHKRLDEQLDATRKRLETPADAGAFIASTGVRADPEVAHAFDALVEWNEPLVPTDGVVHALAMVTEREPVVAETVFELLGALQLIEIDERTGAITPERVLKAAWAAAE